MLLVTLPNAKKINEIRLQLFIHNSGPVVGIFLYDIGGFIFPFEVVGFWCLLCAFGILLSFPNVNKKTDDDTDGAMKNKISFTDMIKVNKKKESQNLNVGRKPIEIFC